MPTLRFRSFFVLEWHNLYLFGQILHFLVPKTLVELLFNIVFSVCRAFRCERLFTTKDPGAQKRRRWTKVQQVLSVPKGAISDQTAVWPLVMTQPKSNGSDSQKLYDTWKCPRRLRSRAPSGVPKPYELISVAAADFGWPTDYAPNTTIFSWFGQLAENVLSGRLLV